MAPGQLGQLGLETDRRLETELQGVWYLRTGSPGVALGTAKEAAAGRPSETQRRDGGASAVQTVPLWCRRSVFYHALVVRLSARQGRAVQIVAGGGCEGLL